MTAATAIAGRSLSSRAFDDWPAQLAAVEGPRDRMRAGVWPWCWTSPRPKPTSLLKTARAAGCRSMRWTGRAAGRDDETFPQRGPAIRAASDALSMGDVILVEALSAEDYPEDTVEAGDFGLRQVPEVNGGIVAIDPFTGRVLSMVGGYSFAQSQFNRAVQARRQPGSSFKPFVYAAALDNGYTPVSIILDAPFVASGDAEMRFYRPQNYSEVFYGPSTLRRGLELSRNVMTVRLAQELGMGPITSMASASASMTISLRRWPCRWARVKPR
jgi:penicillin-binding protein 1A